MRPPARALGQTRHVEASIAVAWRVTAVTEGNRGRGHAVVHPRTGPRVPPGTPRRRAMPSHGMSTTLNRFVAAAFAAIAVGGAVHAGAADADAARLPDVATPPGGVLAPDRAPERRVSSPVELEQVLRSDFKGRVVIPRDVRWVMENPCGAKDEFGR